ncbi:DUF3592 domain-containing protein [Sulfurimonas sp.]|uniref:DUF3592 domain-containing protein n=1 Tax=Sulfurimonas sp. TaxID=2022749 RepID=UPI002B45DD0E|nr:DUF3592 domain-containing protein [Sulfurimonas sp.]
MENKLKMIKDLFTFRSSWAQKVIYGLLILIFFSGAIGLNSLSIICFIILNFIILGISIGALFLVKERIYLIKTGKYTKGVVRKYGKKNHYGISSPIIEFQMDEHVYIFENEVYDKFFAQSYIIGEEVEVLFNEYDPNNAFIYTTYSLWVKPFMILFILLSVLYIDALLVTQG